MRLIIRRLHTQQHRPTWR